jgi:uncharacterized protein (TIGR00369 family)
MKAREDLGQATAEFVRQLKGAGAFGTWLGPTLDRLGPGFARLLLDIRPEFLRHGDTVAGPILMGLADVAIYGAIITVSERGVDAVTSDMTLHFLRRPATRQLIAEARVVKTGKTLNICDCKIFTAEAPDKPVCHIAGSYAVPLPSGA